jgi:hypothetical protein
MNIQLERIKSALYLFAWTMLVAVAWFFWLSGPERSLHVRSEVFVSVFGIFVGIVSGFSPKKAFLVCFSGFFIIAVFLGPLFSIFEGLAFFSVLCGVFGIAGAVIRRIATHQKVEELYLKPWEWVLVIGGIIAIADYVVVPCASSELLRYHRLAIFSVFFVCSLIGLFALGVYAGIFYRLEYKNLMKSVAEIALGGHGVFFIYRGHFFARHIDGELFLLVILLVIFFFVLLVGTHVGYHSRNRIADR